MGRVRLVMTIVTCMTASTAVAVSAQSRLLLGGDEISLETGAINKLPPPTERPGGREVVDGGRYLAGLVLVQNPIFDPLRSRFRLSVWSPRTGQTFSPTPVEFLATGLDVPGLVGDPNRARVFVWHGDTISVVSPSGLEDIASHVARPATPRSIAYAPVAEVLFVARQAADVELAQYSTDGTLLKVTPLPEAPHFMAVSSDGRRVFTVTLLSLGAPSVGTLRSYDGLTGEEKGSVELLPGGDLGSGPQGILLDEAGGRVLIPKGTTSGSLEVRSFDLDLLHNLRYPWNATLSQFDVALDERTGSVVIATSEYASYLGSVNHRVWLVNLTTGALVASAPLAGSPIVLTPPPPPALESPMVAGSAVTLMWSAVRTATNYEIESGLAPGGTVFTAQTNGERSITINGVPAGLYYVRLRALNDSGASQPSPDVVVTVP